MPKNNTENPTPEQVKQNTRIRSEELLAAAPGAKSDKARSPQVAESEDGEVRTVTARVGDSGAPELTVIVRTNPKTGEVISVAHIDHTGKCTPQQKQEALASVLRKSAEVSAERGDPKPVDRTAQDNAAELEPETGIRRRS